MTGEGRGRGAGEPGPARSESRSVLADTRGARDDNVVMSSELLTGAVGLLGAVFGAVGAVWAGSVTATSQRKQTQVQLEAARRQWGLDNKRDVYVQLLRCASVWQSTSWELFHALSVGTDEAERTEVYRRKVERWQDYAATATTAQVFTADAEVRRAVDAAQGALLALEKVCDDWYHGRGGEGPDARAAAFRARSRLCETAVASLAARIEVALKLSE